ncbi:MAG: outer membrane beta-barrel protein [Burkholderiales bacterium]
MRSKATIAILGLAAATLAVPAAAQMRSPSLSSAYIGGSIGQSKFKADCGPLDCDKEDTSFRLFGGYQFTPNIAAELGYASLGKLKVNGIDGDIEATAWDLSAVGMFPIVDKLSILGRLGVARVEGKASGAFGSESDTKNGVTFGLGAQYDFTRNLGLRAEWQRYKVDAGSAGDADLDNLNIGVLWRFQ